MRSSRRCCDRAACRSWTGFPRAPGRERHSCAADRATAHPQDSPVPAGDASNWRGWKRETPAFAPRTPTDYPTPDRSRPIPPPRWASAAPSARPSWCPSSAVRTRYGPHRPNAAWRSPCSGTRSASTTGSPPPPAATASLSHQPRITPGRSAGIPPCSENVPGDGSCTGARSRQGLRPAGRSPQVFRQREHLR